MEKVFIRKGVFETNSSSTHSISIAKNDIQLCTDKLPVSTNNEIKIYPGDFGWDYDCFYDAQTKASYCLTWIFEGSEEGRAELIEQLKRVIHSVMGEDKNIIFVVDDSIPFYYQGSIDHQSIEVAQEAFVSDDTLRAFIFNPQSFLVTDNDNC